MRVTVSSKGADFGQLTRQVLTGLTQANRTAGRDIAKLGRSTVIKASGSPSFRGKKLNVKTRTKARPDGATVEIYGSPAGAWTILDSGARAHPIRPQVGQGVEVRDDLRRACRPPRQLRRRGVAAHRGPVDDGAVR